MRAIFFGLLALAASAQTFEVASVKLSTPAEKEIGLFTYPGGRLTATNYTLKMLVEEAYGFRSYQVSGGPRWVNEERYSLEAKPPAASPAAKFMPAGIKTSPSPEMLVMLRNLLEERFQLKVHKETKEQPVWVLVAAKGGAKVTETKDPSAEPWWAYRKGGIDARGRSIPWLAEALAKLLHRPVLDKTGLAKTYDWELRYDPAQIDPGGDTVEAADASRPSLAVALQQQLGLKLETAKGPVEFLVIDQAAKP